MTKVINKPSGNDYISIPLVAFGIADLSASLPSAADGTTLGHIAGIFGAASSYLIGSDVGGTTATEITRIILPIPSDNNDGGALTIRIHAGMLTTVADDVATVDIVAYKSDEEAGISADINSTGAQSINSVTLADKDFVITPTGLVPGDLLDIQITVIATDAGDLGVMTAIIGAVKLLYDRK